MSSRDRARDKVERVTDGDHPDSQHPDSESGHHQRHHTPVPQMAMPTAQFSLLRAGLSAGAVAWRAHTNYCCALRQRLSADQLARYGFRCPPIGDACAKGAEAKLARAVTRGTLTGVFDCTGLRRLGRTGRQPHSGPPRPRQRDGADGEAGVQTF